MVKFIVYRYLKKAVESHDPIRAEELWQLKVLGIEYFSF